MEPVKDAEHHRACVRSGRRRTSQLAAAILTLTLAAAAGAPVSKAHEPGEAAQTSAAFGRWGFDDSGIDPAVNPGDSFFDYANGAWAARTAIPADKTRFGMSDALTDQTQEQVRAIVTEAARSGAALDTDIGKIGTLYDAFMDEDRIERLDLAPIAADLAEIRDATTKAAIAAQMGRSRHGIKKRASGDVSQPAPVAGDS
jgi:predicted metalloendopeptidase